MVRAVRLDLLHRRDWLRWCGADGTDLNSFAYNGNLRHRDPDADARHLHRPALFHPNSHTRGDADSRLWVRMRTLDDASLPLMICPQFPNDLDS
ncbi:MAG: hypothetical protein HYR72_20920 [Deltaproteobacteria bacterium]|nr:hypothetical protein [Deltaproteobacteria bacterium]MBI3391012.1 hypothetical protein [Deltaproteobacteria bacterium]